jgi:hypothetical protein
MSSRRAADAKRYAASSFVFDNEARMVKEIMVGRINWGRVLLCGLVAGFVWTLLSAVVTVLVGYDFAAAVPGNRLSAPSSGLVAFLFIVNLVEGVWAMWLYAAIRPRYGAGPKTAAVAGFSWWVISSLIDATWGSFGFVPAKALLGPMVASLPAIIVAAVVGAWLYKE